MSTYCMVALSVFTLGWDRLSLNPSSLLPSSSSVTHSTTDFEESLSLDSILAARERDASVAVETRRSSIPWLTMYTLVSLQLIWRVFYYIIPSAIECMQEYSSILTQTLYKHMYRQETYTDTVQTYVQTTNVHSHCTNICTDKRLTQTLCKHMYRQETYTATVQTYVQTRNVHRHCTNICTDERLTQLLYKHMYRQETYTDTV